MKCSEALLDLFFVFLILMKMKRKIIFGFKLKVTPQNLRNYGARLKIRKGFWTGLNYLKVLCAIIKVLYLT